MTTDNPFRSLPRVDELTERFSGQLPTPLVSDAVRIVLDQARRDIGAGLEVNVELAARQMIRALRRSAGVPVINATGVLLHTNLGRARWSERAIERATTAARHQTNLEMSLDDGKRSRRGSYVTSLLRSLTGAGDALVVNNNASGLLLALAATSEGRAVPVARGELIEIGGSYRLPEVMRVSGARMVEVGTTNRTRLGDYETALQIHRCGSVLKVHPSNYRVEGFTEEAKVEDLASLARSHRLPLIHDIGSGLLDSDTPWIETGPPRWLESEPGARQSLRAGADLVTFSGDKLLGGPQAGVIVGTSEAIESLRANPLSRALRVDGVTYAALGATLEAYAERDITQIPFWRQALVSAEELQVRAESVAAQLEGTVQGGDSAVGAGSAPGMRIPSPVVVLAGEDHLYECLLSSDNPVVTRREEGSLVVDLRTVDPESDEILVDVIRRCR